jgi:hypothetical protein
MPNTPDNASGEDPRGPKLVGNREKNSDRQAPDYGALTMEALNRHMNTQEFSARYKAWLEYLGSEHWTPVAKADYEKMCAEDIDPELVAKYRGELESK